MSRSSTFKEEFHSSLDDDDVKDHHHHHHNPLSSSPSSTSSLTSSLAAQAIKASAARRDSYAYSPSSESDHHRSKVIHPQYVIILIYIQPLWKLVISYRNRHSLISGVKFSVLTINLILESCYVILVIMYVVNLR